VLLARDILGAVGLTQVAIHLNSLGCAECRPKYRQALVEYFTSFGGQELCGDCQRRIERNPLRVLDCKVDGPRFTEIPKMSDYLCPCCKDHFDKVQEFLGAAGCPFVVDHKLVRGLDYYTRTVFEVRSTAVGSQDALAAGGRYDNLVKELGGAPTPAVGFALGSERVLLAAQNLNTGFGAPSNPVIFVAVSDKKMEKDAVALTARLRSMSVETVVQRLGLPAESTRFTVEGPFAARSLKSQMRLADRLNAVATILFFEDEFARNAVLLRDMKTQQQREVPLSSLE
jgi:histidyl-tRNA synthetase